jgi:putative transcriptional regulator
LVDTSSSLFGKLLIAMPSLGDPNFQRTVVLLGAHSIEEGAFGLVVNRPLDVELTDILAELGLESPDTALPPVLSGGPVEPGHGFVLFEPANRPPQEDDLILPEGLTVSGSTETLAGFAAGELTGRYSLILGYSGWYPGQLEAEIEENSWLVAPVQTSIVFDVPLEDRWVAALNSIGVDPGTIVDSGSATPT